MRIQVENTSPFTPFQFIRGRAYFTLIPVPIVEYPLLEYTRSTVCEVSPKGEITGYGETMAKGPSRSHPYGTRTGMTWVRPARDEEDEGVMFKPPPVVEVVAAAAETETETVETVIAVDMTTNKEEDPFEGSPDSELEGLVTDTEASQDDVTKQRRKKRNPMHKTEIQGLLAVEPMYSDVVKRAPKTASELAEEHNYADISESQVMDDEEVVATSESEDPRG